MTPRTALLLAALCACTDPRLGAFELPKQVENMRARLLPFVEGHAIAEARTFLRDQGFDCDAPLPSATDAHAHFCRAHAADASVSRWTIVLLERNGRVADVQAR